MILEAYALRIGNVTKPGSDAVSYAREGAKGARENKIKTKERHRANDGVRAKNGADQTKQRREGQDANGEGRKEKANDR